MLKKYGKFYAEWRDAAGRKHRRACPTKKAAQALQLTERKKRDRGKAQASAHSLTSRKRGLRPTP